MTDEKDKMEAQMKAVEYAVRYAINKIGVDVIKSGPFFGLGERQ
ncbi:hypothetical protein [Sulfitobacter sp. 20_GPM-1509m]|nr:hypothetical protein [Sulfitobacter sp. 20_GPM-1509m]